MPLLIRGARQVGKSYSIIEFGAEHFKNCVIVNFEERPELGRLFSSFDVELIIQKLSLLLREPIIPGETLLFFDEIQECPAAITSLRYFQEKLPGLHVIGAGSLIEFVLESETFTMPVGRVQSMWMAPLSFYEFLIATGNAGLAELVANAGIGAIDPLIHEKLIELVRQYLVIGGMPKCVDAFVQKVPPLQVQSLQSSLLQSYQDDFGKYARNAKHGCLKEVFSSIPHLVGESFKYSKVNDEAPSKDIKDALRMLALAQCVFVINHANGHDVPLHAGINPKKFKCIFMDCGLMQRVMGADLGALLLGPSHAPINGQLCEQFAGQELLAAMNVFEEKKLHYWIREKTGCMAEIDYLVQHGTRILPVEVKSGKTGTLKSLFSYFTDHPQSPIGIRFSQLPLAFERNVLSIPLFMIGQWPRLVAAVF